MDLRGRLNRLKAETAKLAAKLAPQAPPGPTLFEKIAMWERYYLGEGPRPPDEPRPPGISAASWEWSQRIGRCFELPDGEYLPEMTDAEREHVAMLRGAILRAAEMEMRLPASDHETKEAAEEDEILQPQ
jgi:hypothetical protein